MVPLGHHLGADENLDGAGRERTQRVLKTGSPAHGVAVENRRRYIGQKAPEVVGDLFGAGADRVKKVASALRAVRRRPLSVATVMAAEIARSLVDDQRHRARRTLDAMAAVAAEVDRRPSPALHEQDRLLATFHGLLQQLSQPAGEEGAPLLSRFGRFPAQVDKLHRRQLAAGHAAGQLQPLSEVPLDQGGCFHRGGRRAQEYRNFEVTGSYQGEVTGVVAWCFLLFVGCVVLLIDNDQSEIFERCKKGGTGADNHPRFPGPDPLPFAPPFAVRKR